jgi:hypothetical protein
VNHRDPQSEEAALVASLAGRTITRASWSDDCEQEWSGPHGVAWLWLDDGRVVEFTGWGYDAWGGTAREVTLVRVDNCLNCGGVHEEVEVFPRFNGHGWRGSCPGTDKTAWSATKAEAAERGFS